MAFNFSPKIVTNGLVLYLDAANTRSYPGSGATWTDLSRQGNNGTLTNGPTFNSANGGSIVFDGVDDRVSRGSALDTGQDFTVNAWIYPTLLGITRRAVVASSYSFTGRNGWLLSTSGAGINNTFYLSVGSDSAYRVASAGTLSLNTWQYITAVVTGGGGAITLYLNGNTTTTATAGLSSGTITYTSAQLNVGFRFVGGVTDPYTGNIASVQVYNRALSITEVLQNYNATKTRFGLT